MSPDWELLRKQKLYLLAMSNDPERLTEEVEVIDGVIHLIDWVQDQAVLNGDATNVEVFGEIVPSYDEMLVSVINDAANTCQQDGSYLRDILKNYFGSLSGEELKKTYNEAFKG